MGFFWEEEGGEPQNNHFQERQKVAKEEGESFSNILFQNGLNIMSKWFKDSYFKMQKRLFQSRETGAVVVKLSKSFF